MSGILKVSVITIIAFCYYVTAFSAVPVKKHRQPAVTKAGLHPVPAKQAKTKPSEPPTRHVILPADKKLEKPQPKKERSPSVEQDFSPFLTGGAAATLGDALKAYRAGNLPDAISETKRLIKEGGGGAEAASYFLGEFYLKQAESGDKEAVPSALAAFQKAVLEYPRSNFVTFGQFRMAETYTRARFYHEAIGNFKRIVDRGFDDPFTLKAKIGIAKVYQAWGRWPEAKVRYEALLHAEPPLSPEDAASVLFGQADVFYQMGQFEDAYQGYKKAALAMPSYRYSDPLALFQLGEAAYRAGHFQDTKLAFLYFYNIYPRHPLTSVALARIKVVFNNDGKTVPRKGKTVLINPKIPSIDDTLQRLAVESIRASAKDPVSNLGKILLSMEAIKNCLKTIPPKVANAKVKRSLQCDRPLVEEAFYAPSKLRLGLREGIKANAMDFLNNVPPSTTAQGILLEAIYQLKKYKEIEAVVEIETTLLVNLPLFSPYLKEVEDTLHETIVKELGEIRDPEKIVTLYYAYPAAFTKQMLNSEIGYTIAMSHIRTGLLSKGVALLKPVSENFIYPFWKEAIYQSGKASVSLGDYGNAQQALEQYQRISSDKEKAFADLGNLHFKRGDVTKAILAYERWLSHFPKHTDRPDIYLKLSEAYRYQNDFDNEIKVYSKWIAERKAEKGGLDIPSMRLADTYFQLAEYNKAISSYRSILERSITPARGNVGEKELEWAKLRIARSYELLGQDKEGKKYLENIAKKTKNPLIRQIVAEKKNPA